MTATPARIRRCIRESEFAVRQDPAILAVRPDARPAGGDDYTTESFFDLAAHAQVMTNERFSIMSAIRRGEAAESSEPLRIGRDVPLTPALPRAKMVDRTRGLDRSMLITGLAVDHQSERNSIEARG